MTGVARRAFPVMVLVALGVVAYQQIKIGNYPPPPTPFVGVALVYSLLSVLSLASPELAAVVGLAIVLWLVFAYAGVLQKPTTTAAGAG